MPLDSIIVRGAREHNQPDGHSDPPQAENNLGRPRAGKLTGETLRCAQGDMVGRL